MCTLFFSCSALIYILLRHESQSTHASTIVIIIFSSSNPTTASKKLLISAHARMLYLWTYLKSAEDVPLLKVNSSSQILTRYGCGHFTYWTNFFSFIISFLLFLMTQFFFFSENWTKERSLVSKLPTPSRKKLKSRLSTTKVYQADKCKPYTEKQW